MCQIFHRWNHQEGGIRYGDSAVLDCMVRRGLTLQNLKDGKGKPLGDLGDEPHRQNAKALRQACEHRTGEAGGRSSKEARETGGSSDGLGSHIEVLDFQPCEPPDAVGNLSKERQEIEQTDSISRQETGRHNGSTWIQLCLKSTPGLLSYGGQLLKPLTPWFQIFMTKGLSRTLPYLRSPVRSVLIPCGNTFRPQV